MAAAREDAASRAPCARACIHVQVGNGAPNPAEELDAHLPPSGEAECHERA